MNYGKYDRVVTIENRTTADGTYSDDSIPTWATYISAIPARMSRPNTISDDESYEGQQRVAAEVVTWTIVYPNSLTITDTMRVSYQGGKYYINRVKEVGRREEIELTTQKRDNE